MSERAWFPEELWGRASAARRRLLMLDYDGTLAPFRVDRLGAFPVPGVLDLLARISSSRRTRLAILSGRPVAELTELLCRLPITLVGEHGWEVLHPDGTSRAWTLPDECAVWLARAGRAVAEQGLGDRMETKRSSLMLHTRALPLSEAGQMEELCARLWEEATLHAPLRVCRVNGGVELRTVGRDKGTAVRELLAGEPEGTLPVYAGDDATDEDAFAAVKEIGFGLLVSGQVRPTLAGGRLPSISSMREFLGGWLAHVEGERGDSEEPAPGAPTMRPA